MRPDALTPALSHGEREKCKLAAAADQAAHTAPFHKRRDLMTNLCCQLRVKAAFSQLAGIIDVNMPQQVLHASDSATVHRQMAVSQTNQDRNAH